MSSIHVVNSSRAHASNSDEERLLRNGRCVPLKEKPLSLAIRPFMDPTVIECAGRVMASAITQICADRRDHGAYTDHAAANRRRIARAIEAGRPEGRFQRQVDDFWARRRAQVEQAFEIAEAA